MLKSLTPNIFVNNLSKTIRFYESIGFKVLDTVVDEDETMVWAMLSSGDVMLMFQTFASLQEELPMVQRSDGGSLLLYIQVEDVESLFEKISQTVKPLKELETTFYGATEFSIVDVNNYLITFAENKASNIA